VDVDLKAASLVDGRVQKSEKTLEGGKKIMLNTVTQ